MSKCKAVFDVVRCFKKDNYQWLYVNKDRFWWDIGMQQFSGMSIFVTLRVSFCREWELEDRTTHVVINHFCFQLNWCYPSTNTIERSTTVESHSNLIDSWKESQNYDLLTNKTKKRNNDLSHSLPRNLGFTWCIIMTCV